MFGPKIGGAGRIMCPMFPAEMQSCAEMQQCPVSGGGLVIAALLWRCRSSAVSMALMPVKRLPREVQESIIPGSI